MLAEISAYKNGYERVSSKLQSMKRVLLSYSSLFWSKHKQTGASSTFRGKDIYTAESWKEGFGEVIYN